MSHCQYFHQLEFHFSAWLSYLHHWPGLRKGIVHHPRFWTHGVTVPTGLGLFSRESIHVWSNSVLLALFGCTGFEETEFFSSFDDEVLLGSSGFLNKLSSFHKEIFWGSSQSFTPACPSHPALKKIKCIFSITSLLGWINLICFAEYNNFNFNRTISKYNQYLSNTNNKVLTYNHKISNYSTSNNNNKNKHLFHHD